MVLDHIRNPIVSEKEEKKNQQPKKPTERRSVPGWEACISNPEAPQVIAYGVLALLLSEAGKVVLVETQEEDKGKSERVAYQGQWSDYRDLTRGMWGLLSGGIDKKNQVWETPEQALTREAKEELDLDLSPEQIIADRFAKLTVEQRRLVEGSWQKVLFGGQVLLVVLTDSQLVNLAESGVKVWQLSVEEFFAEVVAENFEESLRPFVLPIIDLYKRYLDEQAEKYLDQLPAVARLELPRIAAKGLDPSETDFTPLFLHDF